MILSFIYNNIKKFCAKIQTNLDKYSFLISQKLVEKYFKNISKNIKKNTTHISNITKYYLINVENPNRTLR